MILLQPQNVTVKRASSFVVLARPVGDDGVSIQGILKLYFEKSLRTFKKLAYQA